MKRLKSFNYVKVADITLQILFAMQLCISIFTKQYRSLIVCIIGLISTWLILLLKRIKVIYTPKSLSIGLLILIFATLYLGETHNVYEEIPFYDKSLHIYAGILFTYVGIYLSYIVNKTYLNNTINNHYVILFAFFFAISIGVFWEIAEFTIDRLFDDNCQRWKDGFESGLFDTMEDLISNTIGSIIALITNSYYVKKSEYIFFEKVFQKKK